MILILAGGAGAGPPVEGVYQSDGGHVLEGRYTESWIGGASGQEGNLIHAASWDGTDLGTEWEVSCAAAVAPRQLIAEAIDERGNGHRTYETLYEGGTFAISGDGPWGTGDALYSGSIDYYRHRTTEIYMYFNPVASVTNVELSGQFDSYGTCTQIMLANAWKVGQGSEPSHYPAFQARDHTGRCARDPTVEGEWGGIDHITIVITSAVTATDSKTWGGIKHMYQ